MTLRMTKLLLVFAVAVFYSLLVLNNTTDYNSNFPVCTPCNDDGFDLPGQSRDVARSEPTSLAHCVLCFHHRLGNLDHAALLVGRAAAGR